MRLQTLTLGILVMLCSLGSHLYGESVVAQHTGALDPTATGWQLGGGTGAGVIMSPVFDDFGNDAWAVEDTLLEPGSWEMYHQPIATDVLEETSQFGWVIRAVVRIPGVSDIPGGSSMVFFRTETRTWNIHFGSDELGRPLVRLATGAVLGPEFMIDDTSGGYHLYELELPAESTQATLRVDGEILIDNYSGWIVDDPALANSFAWGTGAGGDTGLTHFAFVEFATLAPTFIRSDCNGDTLVDVADVIHLGSRVLHGETPLCAQSCDANGDGSIDPADVAYSVFHLFAAGPPPPAPFPSCGTDPLTASIDCITSLCD